MLDEQSISQKPTEDLLRENNMLSIHQMGATAILNTFRKIIDTRKPIQLFNQLEQQEGRQGTSWKVKIKVPRLTTTKSHFLLKATKLWNELDNNIREANTQAVFKKKIKNWARNNIPIKPG